MYCCCTESQNDLACRDLLAQSTTCSAVPDFEIANYFVVFSCPRSLRSKPTQFKGSIRCFRACAFDPMSSVWASLCRHKLMGLWRFCDVSRLQSPLGNLPAARTFYYEGPGLEWSSQYQGRAQSDLFLRRAFTMHSMDCGNVGTSPTWHVHLFCHGMVVLVRWHSESMHGFVDEGFSG